MSEASPPISPEEAMLARLAALDVSLAERVHAVAMAATDANEINSLGRTYQGLARSMRQTLALQAKLKREREREQAGRAADARPAAHPSPDDVRTDVRIDDLQDAVGRVIAAATDGAPERREQLFDRFDREMDDWATDELFGLQLLDDHVREVCRALDLPDDLAAAWRKLPDPDWTPDPAAFRAPEPSDAAAEPPPLTDSG